ncbi:hypothetical protein TRAPUB_11178 [Trametes pubescens]|uniref:Uncharacterized protein n=1 Tax=Trametes pubescens TaxID=154538 RepID=A0A1M2VXF2_TRAPU|nr:hypothetical protein TRAPUB_11178 [Trametes pubescens]
MPRSRAPNQVRTACWVVAAARIGTGESTAGGVGQRSYVDPDGNGRGMDCGLLRGAGPSPLPPQTLLCGRVLMFRGVSGVEALEA